MRIFLIILFWCFGSYSSLFAEEKFPTPFFENSPIIFTEAEIINEHTARIPFKLIDHLIVVEAELLDQKGDFIIDTGSESLLLNQVHFPSKYNHPVKAKEASGVLDGIQNVKQRTLEAFLLNNFTLTNTPSDIIDLSHIEKSKKIHLLGIIGYSILKDYEVFIDLHLNQITLSKVDRFGNKLDTKVYSEKIIDSIPFKRIGHTIALTTIINDETLTFALDSGAELNQINKNVSKKVLKNFFPKRRLQLIGASNNSIEVIAGKLFGVKLSETVYCGPMQTILTNLHRMNEAFGTHLDGVLGFEFFQQKRTIINYQKETLYFINYPLKTQ